MKRPSSHLWITCFALVLGSCSSRPASVPNLLSFVDRRNPSPVQRVVVHNGTREVFVSARNALYRFGPELDSRGKATTGPRLDHADCLHPAYPCNKKQRQADDDNKVLAIVHYPDISLLFTCGTLSGPVPGLAPDICNWPLGIQCTYSHCRPYYIRPGCRNLPPWQSGD